ncbi:adenylate kinase-domain-containing protein [Obelidium mucronatum]|nr:adenylate kinase-domain-containing protein [Obelidium mucronatum]
MVDLACAFPNQLPPKHLQMLSPRPLAPEPLAGDNVELSYELIESDSGKISPDIDGHLEALETQLADHLLDSVQTALANTNDSSRGILIEATLGFSPLFASNAESAPALALFSYSSDKFKDNSQALSQEEALDIVEIHSFEPFDRVFASVNASIESEGLLKTKKDVVFVIGGPGSGKGTQSAKLATEFGLTHLSTGDLLRAEVAAGSEVGLFCDGLLKDGKIVPMNIVIDLLKAAIERASQTDTNGILIDGFPRAVDQAVEFERALGPPSFILNFYCPLSVLESRLLERGKTSGRSDDNLESIRKRFATFEKESLPVLEYFGDRVFTVDGGNGGVDDVYAEVKAVVVGQEGLFVGGKKAVIFAVGDGTCPEECHELCIRLSNQHNLTLLSFGDVQNFGESRSIEPISEDAGEVEHVTVPESTSLFPPVSPFGRATSQNSLRDAMSDLDGELAEHLLEVVRFHIGENLRADNPAAGLLVEASLGFSPLFDEQESETPALALFSYPAESFEDSYTLPSFDDALNVLEIVKFHPFEKVYQNVKESVLKEGLLEHSSGVPIIFVLGGPGSGKGTQSVKLAAEFRLTHLSAGDLLREEVASGSDVGQLCSLIMKEGKIVPMEIIIELLAKAISSATSTQGILIDGFPRAVDQAIEFERVIAKAAKIINFTFETIRKRFKTFHEESMPVIEYFGEDRVWNIDGSVSVDQVYESVRGLVLQSGLFKRTFQCNGTYEDETHLLCTKLAEDYNLALLNFGTPTYDDPTVEEVAQAFHESLHSSQQLEVLSQADEVKRDEMIAVEVKSRTIVNAQDESALEDGSTSAIRQELHTSIAASDDAAVAEEAVTARIRNLEDELEETKSDISRTAEDVAANFTLLIEQQAVLIQEKETHSLAKLNSVSSQAALDNQALAAENDKLHGHHVSLVESHERAVSGIQGDLQLSLEKAREVESKHDTLIVERDLLQTQVTTLHLDMEKERLIHHNQVSAFEVERSDLLGRITSLESALSESKTAHQSLAAEHKSLTNAFADALDMHKAKELEHTAAKAAVENQILKLQAELTAALEHHEHTVTGIKGDLHNALEQARDVKTKHVSTLEERNSIKSQLLALQIAKHEEQSDFLARIAVLERELGESKAALKSLAAEHAQLSNKQKDLWELHKSAEAEHANSRAVVENQILKLQAELNAVASERADALMDLAEADEDLKVAHARISDLNEVVHMMKTHIARLTEQSRKSRTAVLEEHVVKLEKTIGSLKAEVQFLKSLIGNRR